MSSNSYTSSMEAQNGSAYSTAHSDYANYPSSHGNSYHATSQTTHLQHPSHTASDCFQLQYGHEYTTGNYGSIANEPQSQSAYVYQNRPISEQQAGCHSSSAHRDYSQHEYYLPPGPSYSTPMYERELIIDDENTGTSAPPITGRNQCSGQTRPHPTHQNSARGGHAQQNGQTRYRGPPPTTQRWSAEYSPEERMRVGLPRWESHDREVQYQQAAAGHEHCSRT